jgi:predicted RNA-binding protein
MLYPDAELPHFYTETIGEGKLKMIYTSKRAMGHLALGLIESTFEVYNEEASIQMTILEEDGQKVEFIIEKTS